MLSLTSFSVMSAIRIRNKKKIWLSSRFVLIASHRELAMGLDHIRSEIALRRLQVGRQRKEILQLQRTGIPTLSAEALLQRMLVKIDSLNGTG